MTKQWKGDEHNANTFSFVIKIDRSAPIQIHIISLPIPIEVTPEKIIEPSVSFTNENYTATNNDTEITLDMKLKKVVGLNEIDLTPLMQFFM